MPSPVPPGLVTPWACGAYDGVLKEMVVGHKDRHQLRWRDDLGDLLALAVAAAVAPVPPEQPVLLVRGGDSAFVLDDHEAELRRRLPDAEVVSVPGAGHAVQSDQPLVLRDLVAARLAG